MNTVVRRGLLAMLGVVLTACGDPPETRSVAEALRQAKPVMEAMPDYYRRTGGLPSDIADLGIEVAVDGGIVQEIFIADDGDIGIEFGPESAFGPDNYFFITPNFDGEDDVEFSCNYADSTVPRHLVPSRCPWAE